MEEKKRLIILFAIIGILLLALITLFATKIIAFKNDAEQANNSSQINTDNNNSKDIDDSAIHCKEEIEKVDASLSYKIGIVDNTLNIDTFTKVYSNNVTYEFKTAYCISPETTFIFEIKNGVLTLTNKNTGKVSSYYGINNFKSLIYVKLYTSFYSHKIYLLTEDGKLYRTTISPAAYIYDTDNIQNIIQLVELPVKIKEIGIIETINVPATAEELLIKDESGIEYYGTEQELYRITNDKVSNIKVEYYKFYKKYDDGASTVYELKLDSDGISKYCVVKANSGSVCYEGTYTVNDNYVYFSGKMVTGIASTIDNPITITFIKENDTIYEELSKIYTMTKVDKDDISLVS